MRNRVFITSITDRQNIEISDNSIKELSLKNKFVLMFVPGLHALYLNGNKYASINAIRTNESVRSVFKMEIIDDMSNNIKDANYISLIQATVKRKFDITSLLIDNNEYNVLRNGEIRINMSVGERIQIFIPMLNINSVSSNTDVCIIDRNHIIHALHASSEPCVLTLMINGYEQKIYVNVYENITIDTKMDDHVYSRGELTFDLLASEYENALSQYVGNKDSNIRTMNDLNLMYNTILKSYNEIRSNNVKTVSVTELMSKSSLISEDAIRVAAEVKEREQSTIDIETRP